MAVPFKVKGVYEYASAEEDDLSFPQGQIVTVTEVVDDDWYAGEYVDASGTTQEGMFPKNFVEKYEPAVPSRPARAPKAKQEAAPPPAPVEQAKEPEPEPAPAPEPVREPTPEPVQETPVVPAASKPQAPPLDTSKPAPPPREEVRSPQSAKSPVPDARAETPVSKAAPSEPAASSSKGPPPPVSEKPAGNSFKDRIAAFNKPAAAAPMPFKPNNTNIIKKPFVAPPPSKNSYVPQPKAEPVQKPYVRDEDPEIRQRQEEDRAAAEAAGFTNENAPSSPQEGEEGHQPQSLKERIALLQQQQREQAQRRAGESGEKAKPKKPPVKKPSESSMQSGPPPVPQTEHEGEGEELQPTRSIDAPVDNRKSMDAPRERPRVPSAQTPMSPVQQTQPTPHERETDPGNEADLSAAGETTDDAGTIGPGDSDDDSAGTRTPEPPVVAQRAPAPAPPARQLSHDNQATARPAERVASEDEAEEQQEEAEEESDEEDDEQRRRRELRERMAKMSGGMGMGAMFGPPGGMPMPGGGGASKKKTTSGSSKGPAPVAGEEERAAPMPGMGMPMPGMGLPGMQRVKSPEAQPAPEVEKDDGDEEEGVVTNTRDPETMPDVEDVKPAPPKRVSTAGSSGIVPPVPSHAERRRSQAPSERGAPPPVPGDRPVPRPPPAESRPVPPPPPAAAPMSPGPGSESDDEMSMHAERSSVETSGVETPLPIRSAAPPVPTSREVPPRPSSDARQSGYFAGGESSASNSEKRLSRAVPPVPGQGPTSPLHSPRPPPPPPPPTAAPPSRQSTDMRPPPVDDEDGEVDYEGDYDTDIASSVKHKDALKSHNREPSGDSTTADETPVTSPIQTQPPPIPGQTRAVPPPPPQTSAPKSRQSMDSPRAPPPMPPPRDAPPMAEEDEEYDPYRYNEQSRAPPPPPTAAPVPVPVPSRHPGEQHAESSDDMYSASPPRKSMGMDRPPPPPPTAAPPPQQQDRAAPLPPMQSPPQPTRSATKQSLDVPRTSMAGTRRSMDTQRPTDGGGQIAQDLDLAPSTQWWVAPTPLPPSLAARNGVDILSESEESSTTKRGGRTTVEKEIYVLYADYSQTVLTARYDSRDPSDCSLEQTSTPPPPRLRQDQLETAWSRFGRPLAAAAAKLADSGKKDTVIRDGRPHSLVLALLEGLAAPLLKEVLFPVGSRAYGFCVYANLANASVQQYDEIRAGDVLTVRNARFEGKMGAMHTKYKAEVGKADGNGAGHVAVVEEWDGTRKKVRVWEQGREKGRLRGESYRLGDLRSGEVRVWRVVGREWVGWESGTAGQ